MLANVFIGDGVLRTRHLKAVGAIELDLGPDLDVELEAQRLALFELEVMDVGLGRDLELLAVHHFLERFLNERFDDLLTNRVLEALLDHRRRRLARAKPRKTHARRISFRGLVLGVAHGFDGDADLNQSIEAVGFLRRDFDVHEGES